MKRRSFIKVLGLLPVLSVADLEVFVKQKQNWMNVTSTRDSKVTYSNNTDDAIWINFDGTAKETVGYNCVVTKAGTGLYNVAFNTIKG